MGIFSLSNIVDCPFFDRHFTSHSQMVVDLNTFSPKPSNDLKIILSPSVKGINYKETETGRETFIPWKFKSASKKTIDKTFIFIDSKGNQWILSKIMFSWTIMEKGTQVSFLIL